VTFTGSDGEVDMGAILMNATNFEKTLSAVLCFVFFNYSSSALYAHQTQSSAASIDTMRPTETAPQTAAELDALVAPIALYPDNLVAQILGAATFPDQVAIADYWVQQNKTLTGSALGAAVDQQTWDASVKALVQFPDVLDNMAKNLAWTSSLGQAFHDQQADVMTAVQVMRQKAQAAGNLKSTPQIQVIQPAAQTIVIQPANPQVVYVPQYNPAVVYGVPYVVPYYTPPPLAYVGAGLSFGVGIGIGIGIGGGFGCFGCGHPWGWGAWNVGWGGGWGGGGGGTVIFNHNTYISNTSWHGGYYNGGYHNSYGYNNSYNHNSYNRNGGNTYNRNVSGNTSNVNRQNSRSFNSDRSWASNSWAQRSNDGRPSAFNGMSGHTGGFGDSGGGGWSSRAQSGRGWGSMDSSGFGGGRFGGGGWGGGGFRGRR
jgi:uncharacterized protein DUF3300